jgi:uncharacterized membrane protein
MSSWRVAAVLGLVAAYAVASHLLMTHASNHPWTVAALFGPLLAAAAFSGWRMRQPRVLLGCAVALVILVGAVARGGVDDVNRLYVLQHAGIHLALAFTFGITLRAGATPLIVAMGEKVHREFTAEMRAYARRLTFAWVVYFIGMVVVSLIVYALAPWLWWSLFCNLITPLAAVGFFVGEHVWRHWRHPHFEPVSLRAAWDAYQRRPT